MERKLDSVLFERATDKKRFELPLARLSAADREFILGLPESGATDRTGASAAKDSSKWKTEIERGKRAFLALPFEKQERGGVCAAASSLNIIKFIDPELKLDQRELFAMFNDGRSGASPTQVLIGLETLGYNSRRLTVDDTDKETLISEIQQSLDAGIPAIAAKTGHAMTLIGYDKEKKTMIIWDQRMPNMKKRDNLPLGAQELSEVAFRSRIADVVLLSPNKSKIRGHALENLIEGEIHKHQILNANEREESMKEFLRHASEPRIAVELRKGHRVFIPDKSHYLEITGESTKEGWPTKTLAGIPGTIEEKPATANRTKLLNLLEESNGVFFSSRPINEVGTR